MRRTITIIGASLLLTAALAVATLAAGIPSLNVTELMRQLFTSTGDAAAFVVHEIRLPRLVIAILVGASAALAGTLLQDSLRNPLAGQDLLGVSAGAAVAVAIAVVFPLGIAVGARPFLALAGGLLVGGVVLLASRITTDAVRLVLIGSAVSSLCYALVVAVVALTPNGGGPQVTTIYRYLAGSFSGVTWHDVTLLLPWLAVGAVAAVFLPRSLNLLQLGDEVAAGRGLNVGRVRAIVFLTAALLVAPVVAVAGPVGFVGLLAPHVARRLLSTTNSLVVIPAAIFIGILVTVAADLVARLAFLPIETPVGLWTTIAGGPLLLLLLRRKATA